MYGVELDEKAAALQSTFNVKVGPFDPADYQKDFFDFITLDQVVEHVPNPIAFIKDASEVLKPAGFIILSTPNAGGWGRKAFGAKWVHWHVPYHRHFFTRSSLGKAARACGLNVVRHETITDSLWLHFQWMHLLYYPSAGEPSEFWVKHLQGNTPRGERSGNRFTSVMWRRRINDCITRLFDMSGFGDNHLCVLQKQPLNHAP